MRTASRLRTAATPLALAFQTVLVVACARIEPPPGGPPDRVPPRLLRVRPESMAVLPKFGGDVEFRFDEVVSEGGAPSQGTGTGDLERLVILSPTTRVPEVRWRRNRITVSPGEGWQPNRVYRVQLLPGVTDLRRNRNDSGAVITFTTGAPAPATMLTGTVVDWTTQRPVPGALVVAVLLPDSLPYRGFADSSGGFSFGPLPRGHYVVYGVMDQNHNYRYDQREAFDSVPVAAGATQVGELWTFVHDTTPPRIQTVTVEDSVSATIAFSQMLDPQQRLQAAAVRLRAIPDSTTVPVISVLPKLVDDSAHPPEPRDTVAPPDTTGRRLGRGGREAAQLTSRPPLFDRLVLRVGRPLPPGTHYLLEIRGVRNVTGTVGDVRGVLTVPERKPVLPDSLAPKQRGDTAR